MRLNRTEPRRGIILMVVLALLTLFAIVGVTFVLYADSEATSARLAREAETIKNADFDPEQSFAYFLGQLIYDVPDDITGVGSALRGHSLARTMYGYNYCYGTAAPGSPVIAVGTAAGFNVGDPVSVTLTANILQVFSSTIAAVNVGSITLATPWPAAYLPGIVTITDAKTSNVNAYNGVGRLHYAYPPTQPQPALQNNDDYSLINYTWFSADGFLRDPERYNLVNLRGNPLSPLQNPYVGGNASYTYPDLNTFFLAAVKADGTVISPSYHRNYTGFGPLDPNNPNWYFNPALTPAQNAAMKYRVLRPRPAEHPNFPPPGDGGGDVKNLTWAPGGNDSFWIDLGAPVQTAPDGTQYKPLFAPLILDLDGRVNLNTAGNILAMLPPPVGPTSSITSPTLPHASNQGWGSWEVNLGKVLYGNYTIAGVATQGSPIVGIPPFSGYSQFLVGDFVTVVQPPIPPNNPLPINYLSAQIVAVDPTGTSITLSAPWSFPYSGAVTVIDQEWTRLFTGKALGTGQTIPGRYVPNITGGVLTGFTPTLPNVAIPAGALAHYYAAGDINGMNENCLPVASMSSSRPLLPGSAPNIISSNPAANLATNPFAFFQQGYLSGGPEGVNHPLLYNMFRSPLFANGLFTRVYQPSDMEALLRPNSITGSVDTGSSALPSDLLRLCPYNFSPFATSSRYKNLVTTLSMDLGVPGVTPYWWTGVPANSSYAVSNALNPLLAPWGFPVSFPAMPPNQAITNPSGTNPAGSEFGADYRAISANPNSYVPTALTAFGLPPAYTPAPPPAYTPPGSRIRLNRPLPPYPHMGAGVVQPFTNQPPSAPNPIFPTSYGTAYDLSGTTPASIAVINQYTAALLARQSLANDIYRTLLAITGIQPIPAPNNAAPTNLQLQPRRWLAQLAVNIVDYIDEDDINTPFNFYTTADGLPAASVGLTQGPDDNSVNPGTAATGANPDFWVFGTELPKVVLNEVLAEALDPAPGSVQTAGESVRVWLELYNTMSAVATTTNPNTQPLDTYRVPLWMTLPAGGGYDPYKVTITQNTMQSATPPTATAPLPDASTNVLGKANVVAPFPINTTFTDFTPGTVNQINGTPGQAGPANGSPFKGPGVDASSYFLIGPTPAGAYQDPFTAAAGVPPTTPVIRSTNLTYTPTWVAGSTTDERCTGLDVMLRRLANPYLPFQGNPGLPNYNPYLTADYLQNVRIHPATGTYASRGKRQPYAAYFLGQTPPPVAGTSFTPNAAASPVVDQTGTQQLGTTVTITFGNQNTPLPASTRYDWLVHLDRQPISPMELLHVSGYQPWQLTQQFCVPPQVIVTPTGPIGDNLVSANLFQHYVPWLDGMVNSNSTAPWWHDYASGNASTGTNTVTVSGNTYFAAGDTVTVTQLGTANVLTTTIVSNTNNTLTLTAPWSFPNATQPVSVVVVNQNTVLPLPRSHRLHRLFEFLECGDRMFGVNGLGRIPGKININTVWDQEILQAILDGNQSIGMTSVPSLYATAMNDPVVQIFGNMLKSRSPSYLANGTIGPVNMGNPFNPIPDDRPFQPLSAGLSLPSTQFLDGTSVATDTLLRLNPTANQMLLFQHPTDVPSPPLSYLHPYMQTQVLNKLYNNVTTRSNVFAVWLTVGFFEVTNPATTPPTLGAEVGRSEGRQVRHRMFAIVDRTNLSMMSAPLTSSTGVPGPTPGPLNPLLPFNPIANPSVASGNASIQITGSFVPNPLTGCLVSTPPTFPNLIFNPTTSSLASFNSNTGTPWSIQQGTQLVIEPNTANEETVVVQSVSAVPTPVPGVFSLYINANFNKAHPNPVVSGYPFPFYTILIRGNPGPWGSALLNTRYDPRLDPLVVPYYSVID